MRTGPMANVRFREWWAVFVKSSCRKYLAEIPGDQQSSSQFLNEGSEEENTSIQKCIESSRPVVMTAWDWVFKWIIAIGWIIAAAFNVPSVIEVFGLIDNAIAPSLNSLEIQAATMYATYFPERSISQYEYPVFISLTLKDPHATFDESVLESRPIQQFEQLLRYKLECPLGDNLVFESSIRCFEHGRAFFKEMKSWLTLQQRWSTLTQPIKGDICITDSNERRLQQTQEDFNREHSDGYELCLPSAGRIKCSDVSGSYRAILAVFEPLGKENCFQRCRKNERCNFFFFQPSSSWERGTNAGQLCALYSHCTEMEATATYDDVGSLYRLRRGKPHPLATTTANHPGGFHPPKPELMKQAQSLFLTDDNRTLTIQIRTHVDNVTDLIQQMDLLQSAMRPWLDAYGVEEESYSAVDMEALLDEDPDSPFFDPIYFAEGPRLQKSYVGADGWTQEHHDAAKQLKEKYEVNMGLITWQLHATSTAMESDFIHTDRVTLPIAWSIVATIVGMPALLMLLPLAVSAIISFTAIRPMAAVWATPVFGPPLFISLIIALSIDYGLFMLVRFRDCTVKYDMSNRDAVFHMMASAGKAVLYSGILLSVACGGLAFIPLDSIRTVGLGSALTIMSTLVVNITMIPSSLLIIGRPLQRCMRWLDRACARPKKASTRRESVQGVDTTAMLDSAEEQYEARSIDGDSSQESAQPTRSTLLREMLFEQPDPFPCCCCRKIWQIVARVTSRHTLKAISLIFLIAIPFVYNLAFFGYSLDINALFVREDPATIAAHAMHKAGVYMGAMAPFRVVVTKAALTEVGAGDSPAPAPSACVDDDRAVESNVDMLKQMSAGMDSRLMKTITAVHSCADAAVQLGDDCSTWKVAGFDLSSLAYTYCPRTCRQCAGKGANVEDGPLLLSSLNYNISREIMQRVLHMKRRGSQSHFWDRYNGTNVGWQVLLNGAAGSATDFFPPETRHKALQSIVSPYGTLISRERAIQLLQHADTLLAPTPASPDAYGMALVDVAPYVYLGCYVDNPNSVKKISDFEYRDFKAFQGSYASAMTVGLCARLCVGRLYFALQSGTKCFCSDFYPSNSVVNNDRCNMPCSGGCKQETTTTVATTTPPFNVRPQAGSSNSLQPCDPCGGKAQNSVYRFQADRSDIATVGEKMEAELYLKAYNNYRNPTDTASLFEFRTKWYSDSDDGADFVRQFRQMSGERLNPHHTQLDSNETVERIPASVESGSDDFWMHQKEDSAPGYTFRIYLDTVVGGMVDVTADLFEQVPLILALAITGAVVVLSSLAFCSIFIALRLLITLGLTLSMVFGMSNYIYGHRGLFWTGIIVCAPIMVGLTMDYDMFLSTHVFDLRKKHGYSTRHAILKGLAETGTTITTAGVIMTVAFAALMLSSIKVLNQFGFLLVGVSLVDTFLVRAVLVPSLMLVMGEMNWWPGKMPPGDRHIDPAGDDAWLLEHTDSSDRIVCCWDQWSFFSRMCKKVRIGKGKFIKPVRKVKEFTPI